MPNSPEQKSIEPPAFSPVEVDAFEQIAAHIKPSWELDDPPFSTGRRSAPHGDWDAAGPVSGARAAGAPAPSSDVSSAPLVGGPSTNGTARARSEGAANAPRAVALDPFASPLRDPASDAKQRRGAASAPDASPARPRPPSAVREARASSPKVSSPSFTDESVAAMRPSRKGLWIGVAVAALAGVAVAFAFMQTSSAPPKGPTTTTTAAPTTDPAPRTDTTAATAPAATTSAAPAPTFVAPVVSAAPPAASSSPAATAATKPPTPRTPPTTRTPIAPPPPRGTPRTPGNRPPQKSNGGIVRDVPF